MKTKRELLGVLAALVLFGGVSVYVYAFGARITTSCGEVVNTVDRDFFEKPEEWKEYMQELNLTYCGTECGIIEYEQM